MYKGKKIFGLVTARSGSKRLKNKNTLKLHKKPLFYWTINEAKKSKYLDNLYISTDDKKIKFFIKRQSKINLINRTKKLSQDGTKSEDVVSDFIKKVKSGYDIICLLQPTSPYRRYFDIDNAISIKGPLHFTVRLELHYHSQVSCLCSAVQYAVGF